MKSQVLVTQTVEVEIDENKFTDEFMQEFKDHFYGFDKISCHVEHLAQLCARGLDGEFIEGYGTAEDMGIKLRVIDCETETL